MDRLPEPYAHDVVLAAGEEFIACWRAVPVRLTPQGRIDDAVWYYGRVLQDDPDTSHGLLVLTNWNLRHYIQEEAVGAFGGLKADAVDDLILPHREMIELEVLERPTLTRPLLRLNYRTEPDPNDESEESDQGPGEFYFLLDDRETVPDVAQAIAPVALEAGATIGPARVWAAEPGEGSGGQDDEDETGGRSRSEESPIHFHAEQEEEE